MNPKIVFISTPEFGAIVLNKLVEGNFPPVLVITSPDKPAGRNKTITSPPVKVLAQKHNIPVIQPEKIIEAKDRVKETDLIIVASYSQIIPKEILEAPKHGSLNLHPSLLPRWRGPSPIQFTIIAADKKTGVTVIRMTDKVDAGPIVAKKEIGLQGTETYLSLHDRLAQISGDLIVETIPKWIEGEITEKEQDEKEVIYTKLLKKEDGELDWGKPLSFLERQIRALNPWPGTYTKIDGKTLKILKAEVSDNDCLQIKEVQMEGKKPVDFQDFLRGHPDIKNKLPKVC